jgi:hypothetical protein
MAEGRPAAPAGLDWDKFTQIVIGQQLSGVLAKMSHAHPEWLPRAVSERLLYRRYRQPLFHADWGTRQARDVLAMLAERHIPVIVLKGCALVALMRRAGSGLDWQGVLARASAWKVTWPVRRMLAEVERIWLGVVPVEVLREAEKLRSGWREHWIDWGLRKVRNKGAASILLAVWNTPGLGWRLRFLAETAFPGERYLTHYFGPEAGKLWPLLNIRRFMCFFGR